MRVVSKMKTSPHTLGYLLHHIFIFVKNKSTMGPLVIDSQELKTFPSHIKKRTALPPVAENQEQKPPAKRNKNKTESKPKLNR